MSLAARAKGLGFSVLTVPDHLVDGCISPFAALGVAAEATPTVWVGPLVLNNDLRPPRSSLARRSPSTRSPGGASSSVSAPDRP